MSFARKFHNHWEKIGLQTRLAVVVSALLLIAAGTQMHISFQTTATNTEAQLVKNTQELLTLLSPQVVEQIVIGDYATIRQLLKAQVDHQDHVERIVWTDVYGRALMVDGVKKNEVAPHWFSSYLDMTQKPVAQRIFLGGVDYGELAVYITHIPSENALWNQFIQHAWQLTLVIVLAFFLIALIMRVNLAVVRNLAESALRFSNGAHEARIPEHGAPEVRAAAHAFNNMATQIAELVSNLTASRLKLSEQLLFSRELIEVLPNPVFFKDHEGRYLGVNKAWEAFFGIARTRALGNTTRDIFSDDSDFATFQEERDKLLLEQRGVQNYEAAITHATRQTRHVAYYMAAFTNADDNVAGLVGTIVDITERKQAIEKMRALAYYDPLTKLPNRLLLMDRLRDTITAALKKNELVALLHIDLDRFKYINDSLGHDVGNALLKLVAQRLAPLLRPCDMLAHIGSDEFTIMLTNIHQLDDITQLAQQILDMCAKPHVLTGHELFVSPSIGITVCPVDGNNADNLTRNADIAMFHAKAKGGATYVYFAAHMNTRTVRRHMLETSLRHALGRNEFNLYYQPKVNSATGRITSSEALLRWRGSEHGEVSPEEFIPIMEEIGLILPVGEWVLRTACAQARAWHNEGFSDFRVAVNLSSRQIQQGLLARQVKSALAHAGLDGKFLEIELTESILVGDSEAILAEFTELHALGVRFSVDDFGTGYSSLSYLKRFPIDTVKVDRSFLRGVPENQESSAIVAAILAMANSLSLHTVAEGVEKKEQIEFLQKQGCEAMQGYYFSKPLPPAEFLGLLKMGRYLPARPPAGVTLLRPKSP